MPISSDRHPKWHRPMVVTVGVVASALLAVACASDESRADDAATVPTSSAPSTSVTAVATTVGSLAPTTLSPTWSAAPPATTTTVASPATTEPASPTTPPEPRRRAASIPGPVTPGPQTLWALQPHLDADIADGWFVGWEPDSEVRSPSQTILLHHPVETGFVRLAIWSTWHELLIDGRPHDDVRALVGQLDGVEQLVEREVTMAGLSATRFDFVWSGADRPMIPLQGAGEVLDTATYTMTDGQPQHWIVADAPGLPTQYLAVWTVEGVAGDAAESGAEALVTSLIDSLRPTPDVAADATVIDALPEARQLTGGDRFPLDAAPLRTVVESGDVLLAHADGGELLNVDPESGAVVTRRMYHQNILDLAAGHGSVWLADFTGDVVHRLDPVSLEPVAEIAVGNDPSRVAVVDDRVWVANHRAGTVSQVDPDTDRVVSEVTVSGEGRGGPQEMVVDGRGSVWIGVPQFGQLTRLGAGDASVEDNLDVRPMCGRMSVAGRRLFVAACYSFAVEVVDLDADDVRAEAELALPLFAIDTLVIGDTVWVLTAGESGESGLLAIDPESLDVVAQLTAAVPVTSIDVAFGSVWVGAVDGSVTRYPMSTFEV